MKDKILYACEGMLVGYVSHQVWKDFLMPILITAICAVVTVLIQHYLKKYLMKRDEPKFRSNGRK